MILFFGWLPVCKYYEKRRRSEDLVGINIYMCVYIIYACIYTKNHLCHNCIIRNAGKIKKMKKLFRDRNLF